jgi:hypothetical protein
LYHSVIVRADEFFKVRWFWANVKELQRTFHSRKSGHFKSRFCRQFTSRLTGSVRQVVDAGGEVLLAQSYQPFKSSAIRAVSQQLSPNRTHAFSIHPFLDVIEIDLVP